MDLADFSASQREALLDLAVLGMYADGHLAAAEDERVGRLLDGMGFATDYERARQYDAAVARVSRHSGKPEALQEKARSLAQSFTTAEQRRFVHNILRDLVASDGGISPAESQFLSAVRESLQVV
jgi:uncharacterized tellurite resistance protein B-like protein